MVKEVEIKAGNTIWMRELARQAVGDRIKRERQREAEKDVSPPPSSVMLLHSRKLEPMAPTSIKRDTRFLRTRTNIHAVDSRLKEKEQAVLDWRVEIERQILEKKIRMSSAVPVEFQPLVLSPLSVAKQDKRFLRVRTNIHASDPRIEERERAASQWKLEVDRQVMENKERLREVAAKDLLEESKRNAKFEAELYKTTVSYSQTHDPLVKPRSTRIPKLKKKRSDISIIQIKSPSLPKYKNRFASITTVQKPISTMIKRPNSHLQVLPKIPEKEVHVLVQEPQQVSAIEMRPIIKLPLLSPPLRPMKRLRDSVSILELKEPIRRSPSAQSITTPPGKERSLACLEKLHMILQSITNEG